MNDSKIATKYAENERWKEIVDQLLSYENKMLKLMILLNDFDLDVVNDKKLRNYVLEIRNKKVDKEFADEERDRNETMTKEEREKLKKEYLEIAKVLYKHSKEKDEWGNELENYFMTINSKLRKYIK
jgi:hypothetical protein